MATKITVNSLADSAVISDKLASSISIGTLSVTGNFTVDTDTLFVDSVNNRVGIGTTTPSSRLHTISTTEQLRVGYDASNYLSATVNSSGLTTLIATGTSGRVDFGNTTRPTSAGTGIPVSTSLMTRSDVEDVVNRIPPHVLVAATGTNIVANSGQLNNDGGAIQIFTADAIANSTSGIRWNLALFMGSYNTISFERRWTISTRMQASMRAGLQFYFQIGRTFGAVTRAQLASKGFGIGITGGTITPFVHNGSAITNGTTFANNSGKVLVLDFIPATGLYIYQVAGGIATLVSSITTGLPTGSSLANNSQIEFIKYDTGAGGAGDWVWVGQTTISV